MGFSIDPLDVCLGDQLAGFMTLGNLCIGVGTRSCLFNVVNTFLLDLSEVNKFMIVPKTSVQPRASDAF